MIAKSTKTARSPIAPKNVRSAAFARPTAIVLLAAVVSAGITGIGLYGNAASASAGKDQSRLESDVAFAFSDRWAAGPASVAATKGDRLPAADCERQDWPYIAEACLDLAGGAEPRAAVRYVTVETATPGGSILTRMPAPQLASR